MNIVDLFCGCGGLSLGLQNAGYNILAAFDNWNEAIAIYERNFEHPIYKQDLTDVEGTSEIIADLHPDMIVGGPPCQDFSSAGSRNEDNGRGILTVCYAQIISKVRPEWFIMENVEKIVGTKKLEEARRIYNEAGYGLTQLVLDASLCGVPQKRKRFFLIGKLGADNDFLKGHLLANLANRPMTIRDYVGGAWGIDFYYRHPRSYARRGVFSMDEPSPTVRGVNRPIPNGYELHPGDPVSSLDGIRCLTTKERSIIQTFPSEFILEGSKTNLEQMIGNAVPVNLAQYVGNAILEYCKNPYAYTPQQLELF